MMTEREYTSKVRKMYKLFRPLYRKEEFRTYGEYRIAVLNDRSNCRQGSKLYLRTA